VWVSLAEQVAWMGSWSMH